MMFIFVTTVVIMIKSTSIAFQPKVAFHKLHGGRERSISVSELQAVWSNGQAIREYQDFLSSGKSALDKMEDVPSIIITADPSNPTPLANALQKMGDRKDLLLSPTDTIPETLENRESFPIYLCLSRNELEESISTNLFSLWESKYNDLVYCSTSKGNIEPLLSQFGLARDSTSQLLVGFTTPSNLNLFPLDMCIKFGVDAQSMDKYAGESSACGKWRDAIVDRLDKARIRCKSCFYREWKRDMWEKSIFDATFHLIGACVGEGTTIADVGKFYGDDASDMIWQLSSMLRGSNAIALPYGFEERMFEFAEASGKDTICTIEPDSWGFVNDIFLQTSLKGLNMGFGDPAPLHTEYVDLAVSNRGLLQGKDVVIPKDMKTQRKSIMREGNLRADGVI